METRGEWWNHREVLAFTEVSNMVQETEHRRKGYGSKEEKMLEERNYCPLIFKGKLVDSIFPQGGPLAAAPRD